MSLGQSVALLVTMVMCHDMCAQAQQGDKAQAPDRLIEAHRYELAAQQEFDRNCSLANAKSLIEKAIQTGRSFRSTNQTERDMMGAFLGEAEIFRMRVVERQNAAEKAAADADTLLKQHKVVSAYAAVQAANLPSCEQRFKNLAERIQQADNQAAALMRQGDNIVQQKPVKAMSHYQRAKDINVEVPNFSERMENARNMKKQLRVTTAGHKALILVVLLALIGGLAYAASRAKNTSGGY